MKTEKPEFTIFFNSAKGEHKIFLIDGVRSVIRFLVNIQKELQTNIHYPIEDERKTSRLNDLLISENTRFNLEDGSWVVIQRMTSCKHEKISIVRIEYSNEQYIRRSVERTDENIYFLGNDELVESYIIAAECNDCSVDFSQTPKTIANLLNENIYSLIEEPILIAKPDSKDEGEEIY